MSETKILVPYDEYTAMVKDSADLASIAGLLLTDLEMVPKNPVVNEEIKTNSEEGTV